MIEVQRFQRVAELFESARARTGSDREAFLRGACADNPDLLGEVRRLLDHHEDDNAPLATPVIPEELRLDMFPSLTTPPVPESIGGHRVKGLLGVGGMGVVYLAEQDRPRREVAIKVIRPGIAGRGLLRRFEFEAAALARLQHPGIAQVYEVGAFNDGTGPRPFFVMERIEGRPLTAYADEHDLDTRRRLELIVAVCDAVHHAHQRGVVHRDIKPANILVDGSGQPRILDFGVARATDSDLQVTTVQTEIGQLVGTLPYMSPEQVLGRSGEVDVRSDVYAIGVTLYELLSGRLPFEFSDATLLIAARTVAEAEPTSLSTLNRAFRGDLDTIVRKAIEKDPGRRYQAASSLAADLGRFLADEPIVARPATTAYQLRKFARRNRGLVAGFAAALVVLVAGTVVASTLAIGQAHARREATRRADDLETVAAFQADRLSEIDPAGMGQLLHENILSQVSSALDAVGGDAERTHATLTELSAALDHVNFTDTALAALQSNIFDKALQSADAELSEQPLVKAEILQSLASAMRDLGLGEAALEPQRQALQIRRESLGNDDPKTLLSIDKTGIALKQLGRFEEAEPYYAEALDGRRRVLGDDDPATLISMINSGLLLLKEGDAVAAEQMFRDVHEAATRTEGPGGRLSVQAANNIAVALERQKRYDEAIVFNQEAVDGRRKLFGDDDLETVTAMSNLGVTLLNAGREDDAAPYLEAVLAARRRILGNNHPLTIGAMSNYAVLLRHQHRLEEAEPLYREAIDRAREAFGDQGLTTLTLINNLGTLRKEQGDLDGAIEAYREAAAGRAAALGPGHPATLGASRNLARALTLAGRMSEAEQVLTSTLAASQGARGGADPETIEVMRRMVELHEAWAKAEPDSGHLKIAADWQARIDAAENP